MKKRLVVETSGLNDGVVKAVFGEDRIYRMLIDKVHKTTNCLLVEVSKNLSDSEVESLFECPNTILVRPVNNPYLGNDYKCGSRIVYYSHVTGFSVIDFVMVLVKMEINSIAGKNPSQFLKDWMNSR